MSARRWSRSTRAELAEVLPNALVVWPIGATEQHGPHLATGTDILVAEHLVNLAVERCAAADRLVIAPPMPFGASDHHHRFGGTLSLSVLVAVQAFRDVLRSMHTAGATRVVLVNGHGGNSAPAAAAAADVAAQSELRIGILDYWTLLSTGPDDPPIPGHAGAFETAVVSAMDPQLVRDAPSRTGVLSTYPPGLQIHAAEQWREMDGFGDDPSAADTGRGGRWIEELADGLARTFTDLLDRW